MGDPSVRTATADDLGAVNDIYNHFVVNTHVTFDLEPITLVARNEWFAHYPIQGRHRLFVADDGGTVLGFASSSPWRPRPAYATSVETSVYVAAGSEGRRIGTRLYEALFAALEGEDVHRAYAGIAQPNAASVALHERFGFACVARFTEQGRKFGKYWDVHWFEKAL